MSNRLFEDKYDLLDCLLLAANLGSQLAAKGCKAFLVIDDDFFPQLGFSGNLTTPITLVLSQALSRLEAELGADNLVVLFCVQHAQDGLALIEFLIDHKIKFIPIGGYSVGGYVYDDKISRTTIEKAHTDQKIAGYSKFGDPGSVQDFVNLTQALAATNHIDGDVMEVGCFRGSSGSVMLDYSSNKNLLAKKFYFFDVFEGFNYDEALKSSDSQWANTHATEGEDVIRDRLAAKQGKNTVHVQKLNIISDPLPREIKKIALANIDVDLYEAVFAGLSRVSPLMAVGGIMICEDAGHTPALIGARYALEKFLQTKDGKTFTPVHMTSGQVFLIKHSKTSK
jgi:hypothetical protein